jgi:hypothetical protein
MSFKKLDLTQLDGFGFTQDALDFLQAGYAKDTEALANALGSKVILSGCDDLGATMSDGYVSIDGELLPFVGGPKAPKIWIEEITDVELFGDSSLKTVYTTRRVRMGNVGPYNLTDLKKLKTDELSVNDSDVMASAKAVKKLNDSILAMLSFETAIILKGCEVSNVNDIAFTLDIAAGVVMIDNKIVSTAAYSGAYPVYIKPDGTFDTVLPVGTSIKFDPHSSQRYADVLKRATTSVGEIKTFKTLSDRFDGAGLGRWEMLGFKICDDMQSRTPVGLDRRVVDPVDNVWDANHTVAGNTGGEKMHQLTEAEMPSHSHGLPGEGGGFLNIPSLVTNANSDEDDDNGGQTAEAGGDQAHNNMQPYRIVVFAERI